MTRCASRGVATAALALLGLTLIAQGAWIPAKAWLAQELIAHAWQRARSGEIEPKPWPWADTWPVAQLHRPGSATPLYVLAGASGQSMAFGPAHVTASAPVGLPDNVALAGHRDTHFAFLRALAPGDRLRLETLDGTRDYVVTHAEIVHESRVDLIERTGRSELTLITCHPFDAIVPGGPERYVVHAVERVARSGSGQPSV